MKIQKFRKRNRNNSGNGKVVEAVLFTGENFEDLVKFTDERIRTIEASVNILGGYTAEIYNVRDDQWEPIKKGWWVCKDDAGNFSRKHSVLLENFYDKI